VSAVTVTVAQVMALAPDWEAVLPVTAFGLTVRLEDHPPADAWAEGAADVPDPVPVPVELIRYSTQAEGVLACVLADVITGGTHVAPRDPEGWFDNPHPLLFAWPDGTYTVRDGNHRVAGAILRGDATLTAHVIEWEDLS
jgi:hypothetical protein